MAKTVLVYLVGGPEDGKSIFMEENHNVIAFAQAPDARMATRNPPRALFHVERFEYHVQGRSLAPDPGMPNQVIRLAVCQGWDLEVEFLKHLYAKDMQNG